MDWIRLQVAQLRSEVFIGCDPSQRGTWLCLLGHCAQQENGGRILECRSWGDRRWLSTCGVMAAEVAVDCGLWTWDGDDLVIHGYPSTDEATVQARRAAGSKGGKSKSQAKAKQSRINGAKQNPSSASKQTESKDPTEQSRVEESRAEKRDAYASHARAPEIGPSPFDDDQDKPTSSADPEAHWRMQVHAEPWARDLKRSGAKIGPGNWEHWQALVETHGDAVIHEAIAKTKPPDRWPDRIDEWIAKNRSTSGTGRGIIL